MESSTATTQTETEMAAEQAGDERPATDSAEIDPAAIAPSVEAVLMTSDRPVSPARLLEVLGLAPGGEERGGSKGRKQGKGAAKGAGEPEGESGGAKARAAAGKRDAKAALAAAVARLNEEYERSGRSFRIEQVAGGYRVMTLPQFASVVAAFQGSRMRSTLSHAALETLAIIAYKQPVTRAQLEAIRGVACGEVLRSLIDRRLVTIAGRAEELGRPLLYGTTKQFLETFGLSSIKDLPSIEELRARVTGQSEE